MAITSKFLRDIRESAEADLPTHASDAASELPDSLEGKLGARKVKPEVDGHKVASESGATKKGLAAEEAELEDDLHEEDNDLPVHASEAASEVPDKLSEEEKDELVAESDDNDEDDVVAESDDKEITEEEDEDKLHEAKDGADDELAEEEEDELKLSEEDEYELSEEEEEKLSEEEDEEIKETADALTKDEELPESFKTKVASIFEAAVKRTAKKRANIKAKKLVENYNTKLQASKKKISETLVNKVDGYLDYVVEEWMKENKVAVESALRSEITEKFIHGLKNLFESHYIEVPAEKANVLSEQERKIKKLETELNEELVKSVELRKENVRLKKASIIKKLTEGMTVSDAARFNELCEGVSFDNAATFGQKLKVIKETYFPKSSKNSGDIDASLLTEGGLKHEDEPKRITEVDVYAQAISRMVKK